jgi:hypothetical protein
MKHTLLIVLALVASFVSAQTLHRSEHAKNISNPVILVIAKNPVFPGGFIIGNNLYTVETQAKNLSSLDPVCNPVPQVCAARFAATVYTIVYADGSQETI